MAQDRYFARTYTSSVSNKGDIDVELWHTSRLGHQNQFFHSQDQRLEVELGLGGNVQTSFYFNHYQTRYSDSTDGTLSSNEIGFSNEWKFNLTNPGKNRLGSALYFEWGTKGGDELELEAKIILDKYYGKNLLAFNASVEYEREFGWKNGKFISTTWAAPVEFTLGYMYNLNNQIGLGFELRDLNDIAIHKGWENSILFGGPTFNYRGKGWSILANYLPQWVNFRKTPYAPLSKVLDVHERAEARIILGIDIK